MVEMGPNSGRKALLIDDDDGVRSFVRARLVGEGFEVVEASNGFDGIAAYSSDIAVVVLDVGLPDIDGFSVLRAIRERSDVPVLMVTGATDEVDRVLGLELGADDYVVKPFLPRELVARVRAVLRRTTAGPTAVDRGDRLVFDGLEIDRTSREAIALDGPINLTAREFDLLAFLAAAPRQVFAREQLLRHVWNAEPGWVSDATVTEHVRRVRNELERHPGCQPTISTIRGAGYRFDPQRS